MQTSNICVKTKCIPVIFLDAKACLFDACRMGEAFQDMLVWQNTTLTTLIGSHWGARWPSGMGRRSLLLRSVGCGFNSRRHPVTWPSLPPGLRWLYGTNLYMAVNWHRCTIHGAMVGIWPRSLSNQKHQYLFIIDSHWKGNGSINV